MQTCQLVRRRVHLRLPSKLCNDMSSHDCVLTKSSLTQKRHVNEKTRLDSAADGLVTQRRLT